MGDPWSVALVGCGWAARTLHVPWLVRHPRFNVATLVDPDESARLTVDRMLGPSARQRGDNLLEHYDLMVIASPTPVRRCVLRAIELSRVVLVEKPLETSLESCLEFDRIAAEHRTSIVVPHNYLQHPAVRRLAARVHSPEFGPIRSVSVTHEMQRPFDGGVNSRGTRWRSRSRGGCLIDLGYHALYLAEYLLRARIATLRCTAVGPGGSVDTAVVAAVAETGARAFVRVSWSAACDSHRIYVEGEASTSVLEELRLLYDGTEQPEEIVAGGPEIAYREIYRDVVRLLEDPTTDRFRALAAIRVTGLLESALESAFALGELRGNLQEVAS